MKSYKEFVEEGFTIPDYPMQKDQVRYMDGQWVTGDAGKPHTFDHNKTGGENLDDMNKAVQADRKKEKVDPSIPGNTQLDIDPND
jgi:hypothetical protein